eukprot:6197226-Pleurochrysis_carterae.AAC.3
MTKKKARLAATLNDYEGAAASRIHFIRADAKPLMQGASPSKTKLKASLLALCEPGWREISPRDVSMLMQVRFYRQCCYNRGMAPSLPRV